MFESGEYPGAELGAAHAGGGVPGDDDEIDGRQIGTALAEALTDDALDRIAHHRVWRDAAAHRESEPGVAEIVVAMMNGAETVMQAPAATQGAFEFTRTQDALRAGEALPARDGDLAQS